MYRSLAGYLTVAMAGLAFWKLANVVQGTSEPWDSPHYLGFYFAALGLSAAFGFLFNERSWRWGIIVVFAQFPIMQVDSPPAVGANMWPVGLVFLAFLALPAAAASTAGAQLRNLCKLGQKADRRDVG